MSLSVFKTFSSGEVLTASDLNSSLTQFTDNALTLISPLTGNLNVNSKDLTNVNQIDVESHMILEAASAPSTPANAGASYGKDVNSVVQFFFREESSGQETQLTNSADLIMFHEVFS